MNAHYEMSHDEIARTRLSGLRRQHRELDEQVSGMSAGGDIRGKTGEAEIIVAKHRAGPTADITVAFQGHYSRFKDMGGQNF